MGNVYAENLAFFKAMADGNRLMIIDTLSCGEMCACDILQKVNITQPTLSHHMKLLCGCGLVNKRKEGKWMRYCLNQGGVLKLKQFLQTITAEKEHCICKGVCACE